MIQRSRRFLARIVVITLAFGALVVPSAQPAGAAITGRLYYAAYAGDDIGWISLAGGGSNSLYTQYDPTGVAVDAKNGSVSYLVSLLEKLVRKNLDGSGGGGDIGATGGTGDRGLILDVDDWQYYWADEGGNAIQTMDGWGGTVSNINAAGATVSAPGGVAISGGKIYWANAGNNTNPIGWANLDGSGGGDLAVTGATASSAKGPAIDAAANKIYWANAGNHTISYANLDGSGSGGQLNTTGATTSTPHGVAIHADQGRIYWTNFSSNVASYAALDGSGGGDLGSTPAGPVFPALIDLPKNLTPPSVSGTQSEGETLTCNDGTWAGNDLGAHLDRSPSSVAKQWLRDGFPIDGETGDTYLVQAADTGHTVSCKETASNIVGSASAPDDAPPADTTLAIKAPSKVRKGANVKIKATLASGQSLCLPGQAITLDKGAAVLGPTDTSDTGVVTFTTKITKKTKVQAHFAGTAYCNGSDSPRKTIRLR